MDDTSNEFISLVLIVFRGRSRKTSSDLSVTRGTVFFFNLTYKPRDPVVLYEFYDTRNYVPNNDRLAFVLLFFFPRYATRIMYTRAAYTHTYTCVSRAY